MGSLILEITPRTGFREFKEENSKEEKQIRKCDMDLVTNVSN